MSQMSIGFYNLIIIVIHIQCPAACIRLEAKSYVFCISDQIYRLSLVDGPIAVSYTHLDVYKRQDLTANRKIIQKEDLERLLRNEVKLQNYVDPVSYTHLDVYKRQQLYGIQIGDKDSEAYLNRIKEETKRTEQEIREAEMCIRDSSTTYI